MDWQSLVGKVADCARRCLMLSTELIVEPRVRGAEALVGASNVRCAKVGSPLSTGVGGVTKVFGVSNREGDSCGSMWVSIPAIPRCCGVCGRRKLVAGCSVFSTTTDNGISSVLASLESGWVLMLFLLLPALNKPLNPVLPVPADAAGSLSPLLLFLRVNAPFSLPAGEGLRRSGGGGWPADSEASGSMMWGMSAGNLIGSSLRERSAKRLAVATGVAWVLSSGDDKVKYPVCEGCGERMGRTGLLRVDGGQRRIRWTRKENNARKMQ